MPRGQKRLREAIAEIEEWKGAENITFMLGPHAPYTCDSGYQKEVAGEARRMGVGLHTHVSERAAEMATIKDKYGCTPPELFDQTGLLTGRTVAAHGVYLTDGDIELMAARGASLATNPVSNLKLANGVAPVPKLLKAGVNVALGTDSAGTATLSICSGSWGLSPYSTRARRETRRRLPHGKDLKWRQKTVRKRWAWKK